MVVTIGTLHLDFREEECTRCRHFHTHMQMLKFTAKLSWLIKKVRPPNTLQCDHRFNETLMEMSSCTLPPCSPEEREKGRKKWSVWFLMSQRAGVCHCLCSGGRVFTMNKSNISLPPRRQRCYYSAEQGSGSPASICVIIHDTWVSSQVHAESLLYLFIKDLYLKEIMHLSEPCLVKFWIIKSFF